MNSSGRNGPVISSYTFGPPLGEGPKPRATLTAAWVVLPGLAAFGAASVAAIALSPASSDSAYNGLRARNGTDLVRPKADASDEKVRQPILQVVTAVEPFTPGLAAEDGSHAAATPDAGMKERPALAPAAVAKAVTGSIPEIDVVKVPDVPEQTFEDTQQATASAEVVRTPTSLAICEPSCESYSTVLSDIQPGRAFLQSEPVATDLPTVAEGPAILDEATLVPQQSAFPAIVDAQPASGARGDLLASEELAEKAESSAASGRSELELTSPEMLAAPDEDGTNTSVASEAALRTREDASGTQTAVFKSAVVREHLARIDAKYAKNTISEPVVTDFAGVDAAGLPDNYDEVQVVSAAGLRALGSSSVTIAEDQLVSIRLGDLISLFQDKLEKPLFVWMSTSSASTRFVTPDTLTAAGLDVQFDPERRQIVLGISD